MSITAGALFAPDISSVALEHSSDLEPSILAPGALLVEADSEPGEATTDPIAPFARQAAEEHDIDAFYGGIKRAQQQGPHASFSTFTNTSHGDQSHDDY